MEYAEALKLSKDEFKTMAKFQYLLLNISDENFDEAATFIHLNFDFNNHSSAQKFCHTIGSIAGIRPDKISFITKLFNNHRESIEAILRKNEIKYYSIFKLIQKDSEQSKTKNEDGIEKREEEVNNLKLTSYIENDNLELFQKFLSQTNTKNNSTIHQKKFFSVKPLNQIELIEYAALCGSLNIFKFLLNQVNEFPKKMTCFAVAGGNYEIIHIIEQNSNNFKNESFLFNQETLETCIEFHRNDLFEYLIESHDLRFDSKSLYSSIISNNFIIMNKYIEKEELFIDFYQQFFTHFISKCMHSFIFNNIPFIEFAIKVKINDEIEPKNFVFCFSFLNYDSAARCLVSYRPEIIRGEEYIKQIAFIASQTEIFDASTVFIKFLNENPENQKLMQEIFLLISEVDNELTDTFLNFDNISVNNEYGPLFTAIRLKNISYVQKLLKNKRIDANFINPLSKITPLIYAYENKDISIFECLLNDSNVDVNKKDLRDGSSVLHLACFDGNFEIVKILIENKKESIEVNIKNDLNQTPLHLAAIENKIEIVEYLVKVANADIEIKDNSGVFFLFLFY